MLGFVCLLLLAFINPLASEIKSCRYAKQRGYFSADCNNLNLWEVPPLQSDIEALDLSNNRVLAVDNDSFQCCTSIKFLYLHINGIHSIEANAFLPLKDLQVLDLSFNGIDKFPSNVSPTLRRLYLDGNTKLFQNLPSKELNIRHLKNLEFLSIARNKLKKIPFFGGSIPTVVELNITNNEIEVVTPDDLAPLCQLKYLRVTSDSLFQSQDKLCDCLKLKNWTSTLNIEVSFTCKNDSPVRLDDCDLRPTNVTLAKREACLTELKNRQIPYWLMIGGGILAALICLSILLYVRYRRRQRDSSHKSGQDRNSAVKYDIKGEENGVNPAFNGYGGGRGGVETTV